MYTIQGCIQDVLRFPEYKEVITCLMTVDVKLPEKFPNTRKLTEAPLRHEPRWLLTSGAFLFRKIQQILYLFEP
jgi:hypothetical protein